MEPTHSSGQIASHREGGWPAVFALTMCVSTLIASEFLPVSLLTPIAATLQVSEGQAGQAIAVSGICAVVTSLFIASAPRSLDRRILLLCLTGLMVVSGVIVAMAPTYRPIAGGIELVRGCPIFWLKTDEALTLLSKEQKLVLETISQLGLKIALDPVFDSLYDEEDW